MHEELFERLLYIANQSGITITEIPGATSDPDVAFCTRKIINIPHNYESHMSVAFRLAHEMSHIQFSNPSCLYTFSPYIKNRAQREPNERARPLMGRVRCGDRL